eukprot:1160443-Pelagomonas_calceolata.AAC.3
MLLQLSDDAIASVARAIMGRLDIVDLVGRNTADEFAERVSSSRLGLEAGASHYQISQVMPERRSSAQVCGAGGGLNVYSAVLTARLMEVLSLKQGSWTL